MGYTKELNGVIRIMNSIARNSSSIQSNGINLPIRKNPTVNELKNWSDELYNIADEWIINNSISYEQKRILQECKIILERIKNQEKILQ